jgi:transposase InsO family protein
MLEEHRNNYNHYRPHSVLSDLSSIEYATKWRTENNVLPS